MVVTWTWRTLAACVLGAACCLLPGCSKEEPTIPAPPLEAGVELEYALELVREFDSDVDGLSGLALDGAGRIYLAGAGGVRILDAEGEEIGWLRTAASANCVAVDAGGDVWVGLPAGVECYSVEGELLASWGSPGDAPGQLSVVTGIAVANGDVYVADAGSRVVHRYDLTGDFVLDIGVRDEDTNVPGIVCPSPHLDCVVLTDGKLLVNNPGRRRVETYTRDGRLIGWWGKEGNAADAFCGCCNPTDIAVTPDGHIVTAEKGIPRVKLSDASGKLLGYAGPGYFSFEAAGMDVAVGPGGGIYVADPGDGKVRVFEAVPTDRAERD